MKTQTTTLLNEYRLNRSIRSDLLIELTANLCDI